uniref:Uncharacterized protein n=1 Tax=Hucho hucho TaxID=62062 RepID=A0A4W5MC29_9TELE
MALNWPGLLSIGVFYLNVLATGVWVSGKSKREEGSALETLVRLPWLEATWVGGGFILGNAEVVYDPKRGLAWAIGPIIILGQWRLLRRGWFIIMKNYVAIMDPFQEKYGNTLTAILFIPSLLADIFWIACVLAALGDVIMDIPSPLAVALSADMAVLYTLLGGLYSVAHTDVIQLIFIDFVVSFIPFQWFCVPFILMSPASADITVTAVTKLYQKPWTGRLKLADAGQSTYKHLKRVEMVSILLFGLMGAGLAMTTSSVYVFWILSGDVMYTVVCAQLICVLFLPGKVNGYGALAGLVVRLLRQLLVGEPLLGVPGLMPLPWDSLHEDRRLLHVFPFRTSIMLVSLATILVVSRFAACLFLKGLLPDNWDGFSSVASLIGREHRTSLSLTSLLGHNPSCVTFDRPPFPNWLLTHRWDVLIRSVRR